MKQCNRGKLQMDQVESSVSVVALGAHTLSRDILSALLLDGDWSWSLPSLSRQKNSAPTVPASHNTGAPTVPPVIHCNPVTFERRAAYADGVNRARVSRGSYDDDGDAFGPMCCKECDLPYAGRAPVAIPPGGGDRGAQDLRSGLPFVGLPSPQTWLPRLPIASYGSNTSANDYGQFARLSYPETRLSYQEKRFRYERGRAECALQRRPVVLGLLFLASPSSLRLRTPYFWRHTHISLTLISFSYTHLSHTHLPLSLSLSLVSCTSYD